MMRDAFRLRCHARNAARFGFAVIAASCIAFLTPIPVLASGRSPLDASDDAPFGIEEAAHLLRRAGFGGTPEQIAQLASLGRDAAVDILVDYDRIPIGHAPYDADESTTLALERRLGEELTEEQRRDTRDKLRRLNNRHMEGVRAWWLERMVVTNRPLQEKMTLFWHGHFTSGYREVYSWRDMHRQNEFLRSNALGEFRDLVLGISKDPAMVKYLDGARNVKQSPNENYARELMELFTLGEGSYSERDIKEAARAFTGWGVDETGFRFYPDRHDEGTKSFFGRRGRLDGEDVVDILMRHPNAPRFMARNLLEFFVYREPSDDVIEALANRIRKHGFGFREVMRDLLRSDEFYSQKARFSQVKSPVELVVGAARALEIEAVHPYGLYVACRDMGQMLFQPPNVKGWDGDDRWITASTLYARYNFGRRLVEPGRTNRAVTRGGKARRGAGASEKTGAGTAGGTSPGAMADMMDAGPPRLYADDELAMTLSMGEIRPDVVATESYDPAPVIERYELGDAEAIVDHYLARLVQRPIDPERRAVLVAALSPPGKPFRLDDPEAARRIRDVLVLMMSMAEYQVH